MLPTLQNEKISSDAIEALLIGAKTRNDDEIKMYSRIGAITGQAFLYALAIRVSGCK